MCAGGFDRLLPVGRLVDDLEPPCALQHVPQHHPQVLGVVGQDRPVWRSHGQLVAALPRRRSPGPNAVPSSASPSRSEMIFREAASVFSTAAIPPAWSSTSNDNFAVASPCTMLS